MKYLGLALVALSIILGSCRRSDGPPYDPICDEVWQLISENSVVLSPHFHPSESVLEPQALVECYEELIAAAPASFRDKASDEFLAGLRKLVGSRIPSGAHIQNRMQLLDSNHKLWYVLNNRGESCFEENGFLLLSAHLTLIIHNAELLSAPADRSASLLLTLMANTAGWMHRLNEHAGHLEKEVGHEFASEIDPHLKIFQRQLLEKANQCPILSFQLPPDLFEAPPF